MAHNGEEIYREGETAHPSYNGYGIKWRHNPPRLPRLHYDEVVVNAKVTQHTLWSEISSMRNMMRPHHIEILEHYPQIGNFFLLSGEGTFKGAVLHNLMIRMCRRKKNSPISKYEYWFLINGKPLRFGAEEFSLVSGLRFCEQSYEDAQHITEGATLKDRRFESWGTNKVTVEAVADEIRRLMIVNDYDDDIPKLFFVWVISAVLMPTRDKDKVVDDFVFSVCDDLGVCERYGWGNKIWEATVGDISRKISFAPQTRQERPCRWHADGCPFIILFWMLESIEGLPELTHCSSTMSSNMSSYPRMLRWTFGRHNYPNCDNIDEAFDKVKIVIPRLMPDEVESQADYYTITRQWVDDIGTENRFQAYCRLTDFFGDNYCIIRDKEGHPDGINRRPHLMNEDVRQTQPRSKRQRLPRRDHDASTSQSQPRPNNEEIPVDWLTGLQQMEQRLRHDQVQMEQRVLGRITAIRENQVQLERRFVKEISETKQQLSVAMTRLERLMLKDLRHRGIDVEENEEGNGQGIDMDENEEGNGQGIDMEENEEGNGQGGREEVEER